MYLNSGKLNKTVSQIYTVCTWFFLKMETIIWKIIKSDQSLIALWELIV